MLRIATLLFTLAIANPSAAHVGSHGTIHWWHWLTEPAILLTGTIVAIVAVYKHFGSSS